MKVEIRDLKNGPVTLDINCAPSALDLADEQFSFDAPVTGHVVFQLVGQKKVLAKGHVATHAQTTCVRCLTGITIPIESEVAAVYENDPSLLKPEAKALGDADHSLTYFDGESISPESELRESLMLELPNLPVCDPQCKGLCPVCGANLNAEKCQCATLQDDVSTWKTALKDLTLD